MDIHWKSILRSFFDLISFLEATIICSLLFIIFKFFFRIVDALFLLVITLTPILLWLIFTKKIKLIKAGDFEAEFASTIKQPISLFANIVKPIHPDILTKSDENNLLNAGRFNLSNFLVFEFVLKRNGNFFAEEIDNYLYTLQRNKNYKYAIFVDESKDLICYITALDFRLIMSIKQKNQPDSRDRFISLLNTPDFNALINWPGMKVNTIPRTTTNAQALQTMNENNLDFIAITEAGKFLGILEQNQIVNKLLIDLSKINE